MSRKSTYLFLGFLLLLGWRANAQLACEYTLQLFDSFGDGWNGSTLTVNVDGVSNIYTLTFAEPDFAEFTITVTEGDTIRLSYLPGFFENEVSYFLFDADGNTIFTDGPNPEVGNNIFVIEVDCPTCPAPPANAVSIDNIRAYYTDISWTPSDPSGSTLVEYGLAGFTPGTGTIFATTNNSSRLQPLTQFTDYEFYLSAACANGDTSNQRGPFAFKTRRAYDVGIIGATIEGVACNLYGNEVISLIMQNFGGLPQTFIPYTFNVNGIPGGVGQPQDGFFTGVIGVDSTFSTVFETSYDFSEPGEYLIDVFTQLQQDTNLLNDTLTFSITTAPFIDALPYVEGFEEYNGGWSVGAGSTNSTWQHGQPNGVTLTSAASGQNAWVTNLTGTYNNVELSYLESPCMDFSNETEDPRISFSLYVNTESCCDELWLESSIDNGETWTKVGSAGTGLNWYNNTFQQWWNGNGGFNNGWVTAVNVLDGTAGESQVRLRFVFSTDFSVVAEGIGIDNVVISQQVDDDLAAITAINAAGNDCGIENDAITITVINLGSESQSNFDVSYQVNGGAIVTETTALTLDPGEQGTYTFNATFDSSVPGSYNVVTWSDLGSDGLVINDSTSFAFNSALALPYYQDFEAGIVPNNWTYDTDLFVNNGHNSPSFVLSDNLYSGDPSLSLATPAFGPVLAGDVLYFDYRYTLWSAGLDPHTLSGNDRLEVDISTDCGQNYTTIYTIDANNHVPTAAMTGITLPLDAYVGEAIKVRFRGTWGTGDYWLDLDNIFLQRCASLDLAADVTGATGAGAANGSATVIPGIPTGPYTYQWSNGDMTATTEDLLPGVYTVTVTDNFDCVDVLTVVVDVVVGTSAPEDRLGRIDLAPNPSSGQSWLELELNEPMDIQVQVLNLFGQTLWQSALMPGVSTLRQEIDLGAAEAGLYLIRVNATNGQSRTLRWLKMN